MITDVLLELAKEMGLEPKKVSSTGGGEYHSSCPKCDGFDRFMIWPYEKAKNCTGRYWCRQCDIKGDSIQFCRNIMGMEWDEACNRCNADVPRRVEPSFYKRSRIRVDKAPPVQWQEKMRVFVDWAANNILYKPDVLSYLEGRGLPLEAVKRYKIGYTENPEIYYGHFKLLLDDIGLQDIKQSDGRIKKTMWIPRGIVIPTIEPSDKVIRVKIRRSDWKPNDKTPKYIAASGSMGGASLIGDFDSKVMVVVESELDAYTLHDKIGDFALVVAVGGNTKDPDLCTDYLAKKAKHLLIAHDKDEAGRKMWDKWSEMYPHARSYITNKGKDVGEAAEAGENLREWILEGLPDGFIAKVKETCTFQ